MKKVILLMLLLVIILSCVIITSCTCGKVSDIIPALTKTQGQAQTQQTTPTKTTAQTTKPSGNAESFGDIPIYPGADQLYKMKGEEPMDGKSATVEHRLYGTSDSPDKVVAFYKKEMPANGWNETFWSESDLLNMGTYEKNGQQSVAVIAITSNEEGGSNITLDKKTVN